MALTITGRLLHEQWGVNARYALSREDVRWHRLLERFAGALFDANGYMFFKTERSFHSCSSFSIRVEVNVRDPKDISALSGYKRVR